MSIEIRHLTARDVPLLHDLLTMFGEVFGDMDTYTAHRPGDAYLRTLLLRDSFIALAALKDGVLVGGIGAYELHKFEQERSESTSTISPFWQDIGERGSPPR